MKLVTWLVSRQSMLIDQNTGMLDLHILFSDWFIFCVSSRPGPSSPLPWMRDCVLQIAPQNQWRDKILLGLNLYGLDFTVNGGAVPLLGDRYGFSMNSLSHIYICIDIYIDIYLSIYIY